MFQVVEELYEAGVKKPLQLNSALLNRGISGHSMKQLNNFLTRLKTKVQGPATISYLELEEWCSQHSIQPEEDDCAYVVHHDVSPTSGVHVIMSTKRLLANAAQSEVVHLDATYKLTWNGFPVIIAGVSDQARQFFPVVFGVMQAETSEEYGLLLNKMKTAVEEVSGKTFEPRIVVADCADAITTAISQVFPEAKRGHCWFHVKKAAETHLRRESKDMQAICKADIANLQLCYCQDQFDMAAQLALNKWRQLWPDSGFPAYFEDQYVARYGGWFEGFDLRAPSTNNGLESLNGSIKTNHTLRERLPVGRFVVAAQSMIRDWSRDLTGRRQFQDTPIADLAVMTKAHQYLQQEKVVVQVGEDSFFVRSGEELTLSNEQVDAYVQMVEGNPQSFDEFVDHRFSMWRVQDTGNRTEAMAMWCTCPEGLKKFVCKHSLAIGSLFGLIDFSDVARAMPVGRKRKRGRPTLARPALEHQ
ncbi:hypothetical protein FJT64_007364 [Amphibalanus amphitrite]|uniref:SWIM-type domain-containing protein n=1 Tax=Amphibalanus amphitrite TaxID=1232801 RepID=A0A6A4VW56_AMPAM|nr:hypothetical protein FJT64_007364 [Amphibalanus amphitrite]